MNNKIFNKKINFKTIRKINLGYFMARWTQVHKNLRALFSNYSLASKPQHIPRNKEREVIFENLESDFLNIFLLNLKQDFYKTRVSKIV